MNYFDNPQAWFHFFLDWGALFFVLLGISLTLFGYIKRQSRSGIIWGIVGICLIVLPLLFWYSVDALRNSGQYFYPFGPEIILNGI